jgi:hypothetical protein
MPTPKLEVRHYRSEKGNTFMVYRYWDDKNNNCEYQVYKLVQTKESIRELGISDRVEGRTVLNAREMGNKLFSLPSSPVIAGCNEKREN